MLRYCALMLLLLSAPGLDALARAADAKRTASVSTPMAEGAVTYRVKQLVSLEEIPKGAKKVRLWVSIPSDEANQKLRDFQVTACPGEWSVVEDKDHRGRFLDITVNRPEVEGIDVEVEFVVTRQPVFVAVDPNKVGPMSESLKRMLAEHLATDAPHMSVTTDIQQRADAACGDDQNIATQAKKLLAYVAATVDHYSISLDPAMPKCGIGDAGACLGQGGGCCTDLNSLFISLARARGIASRLQMGYRLQEKNINQRLDAGYRCWVEYFVPNYGWVSADVVEADRKDGLGPDRWFTGLTARRVWLNQGREFRLADDQTVDRVNHMSLGYAEIDGKPVRLLPVGDIPAQITREVLFTEVPVAEASEQAVSN